MSEYIASVVNLDLKDGSTIGRTTRLNNPLEEIVRCRECKYFDAEFTEYDPRPWCNALDYFVKPDFYCAWGVRE